MPDKSTWQFINSFAPWLAALGTLLAVIISLYLARRDKQIRISVNAYITTLINSLNNSNQSDRYLCIEVTNTGHRTANITSINQRHPVRFLRKHVFFSVPLKRFELSHES